MPKRPKTISIPEARRQVNLGGLTWAAWRQRVKPAELEAALQYADATDAHEVTLPVPPLPEPELQIEPGREWTPQPDRRTAPTRPARMHTRTPSRPAVDLPAPPPPSALARPPAPPGPRFTRQERLLILNTIDRHQPISRTLILNRNTGMRLGTLDAILADLLSSDRITLADGKYRTT